MPKKHAAQMTLGELIAALRQFPVGHPVYYDVWNAAFTPRRPASYRGYYCDLALGHTSGSMTTVGDLLGWLEVADGRVYEGWKGGDYEMTLDTVLWVDNPGECHGIAIVGVRPRGNWGVIIETEQATP